MDKNFDFHYPVLLEKALGFLNVKAGRKYIDATVGGGGHSAAILRKGGVVLGIDCDPEAIAFVKGNIAAKLKTQSSKLKIARGNFRDIDEIAKTYGYGKVDGILIDLGVSSWQLEHSGRGFSFQKDEPLDMRMDPTLRVSAADLVNGLSEKELYELFKKFGEENLARGFARLIVQSRSVEPIRTSKKLAIILANFAKKVGNRAVQGRLVRGKNKYRRRKTRTLHPATKVFQALRIAVNDEINNLREVLPKAVSLLEFRGRLVVISFHSLEDRVVKHEFKRMEKELKQVKVLTPKPVRPDDEEIDRNPRARSARLRVVERKRRDSTN